MLSWFRKKSTPPKPAEPAMADSSPLPAAELPTPPDRSPEPPADPAPAAAPEVVEEDEPDFDTLRRRMEEAPQDAALALEVARAGVREGRTIQALPIFHRAARMLLELDPDQGIAAYAELRKLSELGADVHFALADIHQQAGRMREAEMEVRSILRSDMNHIEALLRLCDLSLATERFRDAELVCNRILGVDPRDPFAREKLGEVHRAAGKPDEAVKAFLMAAHSFVGIGEKAEAVRLYERVIELDPFNPTASRELPGLRASLTEG